VSVDALNKHIWR